MLRKGADQWEAGLNGEKFYFDDRSIQVLTELAQNLQQYTTNYSETLEYVDLASQIRRGWVIPSKISTKLHIKKGELEEANKITITQCKSNTFRTFLLKGGIYHDAIQEMGSG